MEGNRQNVGTLLMSGIHLVRDEPGFRYARFRFRTTNQAQDNLFKQIHDQLRQLDVLCLRFYLLLVLPFLFSIPTIIPDGGSFLFSFAASASNFFTPDLFTSATLRSFTCRTPFPVPSSSFSGSGSAAPRMNANVTCSLPTRKQQSGPFESNDGIFHGFTYSSPPFSVFFTSARTAFVTPSSFPAFFT